MSSSWSAVLTHSFNSLRRKKMSQASSYDPNVIEVKSKVSADNTYPLSGATVPQW